MRLARSIAAASRISSIVATTLTAFSLTSTTTCGGSGENRESVFRLVLTQKVHQLGLGGSLAE